MRSPNHMNVFLDPAFGWPGLLGRATERQDPTPILRGRCVGGTSAINGQIAIQGTPEDFDGWAACGCAGWSYREVLPHLRKLEDDLDFPGALYHGAGGPIPVRRAPRNQWGAVDCALADAAIALGYPWSEDHNAPGTTGVSPYAINNRGGDRVSCGSAYIEPARSRPNLEIRADTLVDHVLIVERRAVGVRVRTAGETHDIPARSVVVSAGAFHSPAILMRSGIGPRATLEPLGIPVIADLALENFVEMRDRVADPHFLFKKKVDLALEARFPGLYVPKYAMVTFHRIPYAVAQQRGRIQDRLLDELCAGMNRLEDIDWSKAAMLVHRDLTPLGER